MPPRAAPKKARENDYSNVGKAGRRTGVTIPEGRRDEFGIEEITGIFSSPRRPSPAKQTPPRPVGMRRSLRGPSLPRSASPRKSGISGTARRTEGLDISPQKQDPVDVEERDESPQPTYPTPVPINGNSVRRFSPEGSPLRLSQVMGSAPNKSSRKGKNRISDMEGGPHSARRGNGIRTDDIDPSLQDQGFQHDDDGIGVADDGYDDLQPGLNDGIDEDAEGDELEARLQDGVYNDDGNYEPEAEAEPETLPHPRSNRKRKSGDYEEELYAQTAASTQPNTKKPRTGSSHKERQREGSVIHVNDGRAASKPKKKGRPFGTRKDPNIPVSAPLPEGFEDMVEKIKARPGKNKSLYILRRETPTDDAVTHTRSGRVSVKPLAYWRNERCVYGDSRDVPEGSRFPLTTIKEIIRTEEVDDAGNKKGRRGKKPQTKGKRRQKDDNDAVDGYDDDDVATDDGADDDAEPWEVENGVFNGPVSGWDPEEGILSTSSNIDIAFAPLSIETREVKNATFRYSKLLSTPFFGAGIVDLPPGGEKRSKNSRKMQMCFYVFEGRVNVEVGLGNVFSVAKGGMWQVPRGNNYAIANLHTKSARLFFSQGCEVFVSDNYEGGAGAADES